MASVAPQVTQIWRSGSTSIPYQWRYFSASASRMDGWPQVIGYWLTSASIAAMAACLTASGAGKSGKPWARLIASCSSASLVISLITDSVSAAATADARAAGRGAAAGSLAMQGPLAWRGARRRNRDRSWSRLGVGRVAVGRVAGELAVEDVGDPVRERAGQVAADIGRGGVGPPGDAGRRDHVDRRRENVIGLQARDSALALELGADQVRAQFLHQRGLGDAGVLSLPPGEILAVDLADVVGQ